MKIVVDSGIPFIEGRFPTGVETVFTPGDQITRSLLEDADALVVRTRTKCNEHLLSGTSVKLVATATIGTDHIDLPWCGKNDITVRNAPGCNAGGVAQYVFASLFNLGFDPENNLLGIVGYGNVGKEVARMARDMGIRYLVSDAPKESEGWKDADYKGMEEILEQCDAVTLHVPYTKTGEFPTAGLIGEKELSRMKTGAFLVNSSRGGVVDEKALKVAIKNKDIKAILDVWENEPAIDRELLGMVKIGTPHIAGYSLEGKKRGTRIALEAVNEILGIDIDFSGLECVPFEEKVSRELIEKSYNPGKDYKALLKNPGNFEKLRNNYEYRHEPSYLPDSSR